MTGKSYAPILEGDLEALVARGLSDHDLAAEYGVSTKTILRWRKDRGLPPGRAFRPHRPSASAYNQGCRCDGCREACRVRGAEQRADRAVRPVPESVAHGKATTYSNWKCRCDLCGAAWKERCRRDYLRRAATEIPAGDPRHGRYTTYTGWGCRCEPCRAAEQTNRRERKAIR